MRERLTDIERTANRMVTRRADLAERQATEQRGIARKHTTTADKLQEEKTLRSRMATEAPAQHAAYTKQVRQQAAEQAAEQARENAQRTQSEYRYQPPIQGRSGPSLGR